MSDPRPRQVDDPEHDVHVKALGGFDVAALAVAETTAEGITIEPDLIVVGETDEAWRSHSEYAGLHPGHDAMQRSYARAMAHEHMERRAVQTTDCPTCRRTAGYPCRKPEGTSASCHAARYHAAQEAGELTLRGLKLLQSFPCLGVLRIHQTVGDRIRVVQCDRCGFEVGVAPALAPRTRRKPRGGKKGDDVGDEAETKRWSASDSDIPL